MISRKGERRDKGGFTLIELMVVIAIIAVLASAVILQIFKQIDKGRQTAVAAFINVLKIVTLGYYADTRHYPDDGVTGINCLTATSQGSCHEGWSGPYIDRWPSSGPWAGSSYAWCSGTTCPGNFGGTSARVVTFDKGASALAGSDLTEIDKKIDGGDGGVLGDMRYSGTTAYFLISSN